MVEIFSERISIPSGRESSTCVQKRRDGNQKLTIGRGAELKESFVYAKDRVHGT